MSAGPAARDPGSPGPSRLDALRVVVEGEARRRLLEGRIAPDPARLAAGWEHRFVADAARAEEMVALYRALGYEAVAEAVRAEDVDEECGDCRLLASLRLAMVYTRRGAAPQGG